MSAHASNGHSGCPRPVAEAPVEALIARAGELARLWAHALVVRRPLESLAALPLSEIAVSAPSLCEAVLYAVRSDAALARGGAEGAAGDELPAGEHELRIDWPVSPPEAVEAIEALRAVLWDALVYAAGDAGLGRVSGRLLRDLADRLSYVCSVVLERSLSAPAQDRGRGATVQAEPRVQPEAPPWVTPPAAGEPVLRRAAAPREQHKPRARAEAPLEQRAGAGRRHAVLVDELVEQRSGARPSAGTQRASAAPAAGIARSEQRSTRTDGRALPWDIPLRGGARAQERARGETRAAAASSEAPWGEPTDISRGAPGGGEPPAISVVRRRPPRERE